VVSLRVALFGQQDAKIYFDGLGTGGARWNCHSSFGKLSGPQEEGAAEL
jgi:hypothetical protein